MKADSGPYILIWVFIGSIADDERSRGRAREVSKTIVEGTVGEQSGHCCGTVAHPHIH